MKTSSLKVSDIGEKQLIERIIQKSKSCSIFDSNSIDFKTSIGDDSALTDIDLEENSYLVSSSDMLIQSSHFPSEMSYYQMGYKSVIVNVSDLASMGAKNIGFLLNVAIPKDTFLDDFDDLICGVIQACDKYEIPLIGGDTNEASEIILSGTAIGQVNKDRALMKSGFNVGDLVCISGEIGLAALGFELLRLREILNHNLFELIDIKEKIDKSYEIDSSLCDMAIFKALKPEAKYAEGHILSNYNSESSICATDITDGLASEFYEILDSDKKFMAIELNNHYSESNNEYSESIGKTNSKESDNEYSESNENTNSNEIRNPYSKGIRIYEDKLPVEEEFKQISEILGLNYLDLVLHVGEDFEFLFTISPEIRKDLEKEMEFYVIGEISENNNSNGNVKDDEDNNFTVEIVLSNGETEKISSKGYEHLS